MKRSLTAAIYGKAHALALKFSQLLLIHIAALNSGNYKHFNMSKMFLANLQSPRSGRPVANQYLVCLDDGTVYFQSYSSIIAKREPNGEFLLSKNAWLSRTTKRYLKVFLDKESMSAPEFNKYLSTLKTF